MKHDKKFMNKLIGLSAVSLLLTSCAFAAKESSPLDWKTCQETAMKYNPSLAGYRYLLESSRYSYYASRNKDLPYPGVTASHSYTRSGGTSSPSDAFSLGLNASETLFSYQNYTDLKSQLKSVEQADLNLRTSLADTRKTLLTSFVNLLYMQEKIKVMEDVINIRRKSAETIDLKYESGRESAGNRLQTQAQLAQAEADLEQAKRDTLTARRNLTASMGQDEFVPYIASGTLASPAAVKEMDVDDAALSVLSVLSAKKSLELSEIKYAQSDSTLYPSLSASQSLGWNGASELPGNRNWSLGLSLSWPLFSNGPTYYANNKAALKNQLEKVKTDYRSAVLAAKYNLQAALADLQTNIAGIKTSELLLEAARRRHEESEIQYLAGTLTFQNWQDVESELVSAEQSYLSSLKSANISRIQMDNLLGVPLGD